MSKIIAKEWRSGKDCVGIVATQIEETGLWRAYIGVCQSFLGTSIGNEETDAQYIADWGAKLNKVEATAFFPNLDANKFDEGT